MEWFVYREHNNKIEPWNVFDHYRFLEEIKQKLQTISDKDEFSYAIRTAAQYYFWSKVEYEILLYSMFSHERPFKIDIYQQLRLNWPSFIDYIWNHKDTI